MLTLGKRKVDLEYMHLINIMIFWYARDVCFLVQYLSFINAMIFWAYKRNVLYLIFNSDNTDVLKEYFCVYAYL